MRITARFITALTLFFFLTLSDSKLVRLTRRQRKHERAKMMKDLQYINDVLVSEINFKFFIEDPEQSESKRKRLCLPKVATKTQSSVYRSWPAMKRQRRKVCRQKSKLENVLEAFEKKCAILVPQMKELFPNASSSLTSSPPPLGGSSSSSSSSSSKSKCQFNDFVINIMESCKGGKFDVIKALMATSPIFTTNNVRYTCSRRSLKTFTIEEELTSDGGCTCEKLPICYYYLNEPYEKIEQQIFRLQLMTSICV